MMNETLGKIHFWLSFVGAYAIFMPFHYLGMAGNVRRYQAFVDDYMQPLDPGAPVHHRGGIVNGAAQLIFLYNLIHSRFRGEPASDNPWEATSLEWSTPTTPPPHNNFGDKLPVVYHDPYQYGVQSSVGDYVMQASPEQVKSARDESLVERVLAPGTELVTDGNYGSTEPPKIGRTARPLARVRCNWRRWLAQPGAVWRRLRARSRTYSRRLHPPGSGWCWRRSP